MKGLFAQVGAAFSWISEQVNSVVDSAKNIFNQFSAFSDFILSNETIRRYSFEWFVKMWAGFSVAWHPNVVPALLNSPKSRKALALSFWHNIIIYGGTAVMYEVSKNMTHYYYPDTQDSYSECAIDWCAYAYLINECVSRLFDNMFGFNQAIASAAFEENPHEYSTVCSHNEVAQIQGALAEPVYYLSDMVWVKSLNVRIPLAQLPIPFTNLTINNFVISPFKALLLGRSMADYKFGKGKCTPHRDRLYSQNNAYLLGFGFSLLLYVAIGNYLVKRFFDAESFFIDDAITNFIAQYFIFVAFTRDQVLPIDEKKPGRDLFYYNRLMTTSWTKQLGEIIVPRIANPKMRGPLIKALLYMYHAPFTGCAIKIIVPRGFRTIESIARQPGIQLFLRFKHDDIEEGLKGFEGFRESYGASILIYLPNILVPQHIKDLIKCTMRREWDQVLEFVRYTLRCAKFDPEPANVKLYVSRGEYKERLCSSEMVELLARNEDITISPDINDELLETLRTCIATPLIQNSWRAEKEEVRTETRDGKLSNVPVSIFKNCGLFQLPSRMQKPNDLASRMIEEKVTNIYPEESELEQVVETMPEKDEEKSMVANHDETPKREFNLFNNEKIFSQANGDLLEMMPRKAK